MRMHDAIRRLPLVLGALLGVIVHPALPLESLSAQNVLTISSATATIPQPGVAQYDAGFSASTSFTFTLDAASGGSGFNRIMAVRIRCQSVTGGKACSDVQWRSNPDVSSFTDMTATFVTVQTRCIQRGAPAPTGCPVGVTAAPDPYVGTIDLRMKLSWAADVPAAYAATIRVTLDVFRQ